VALRALGSSPTFREKYDRRQQEQVGLESDYACRTEASSGPTEPST
jgi:hypothetical protein